MTGIVAAALLLSALAPLGAATYYVDYDTGADTADGRSPESAFKHCPGDPAATGAAKAVALQPGDTVRFKGGVVYRGMVVVKASGAEARPILFDGNADGTYGKGPAVIEGAEPLSGWKRCASAEEAGGNPRWAGIFYAGIPKPSSWRALNLCDEEKPLPIAQDPNPADPIFQEDPSDYYLAEGTLGLQCPARVVPEPGLVVNASRPLIHVIVPGSGSAVVDPIVGGAFSIELPEPVTAVALGIAPQPRYAAPKEVAFLGDGKELLRATLQRDQAETQRFDLPAPATFSRLTVKLLSAYEGEARGYTAIGHVAAYDADGKNLLEFPATVALTDPKHLTAASPDAYQGMTFAFHGGANIINYLPVEGYDPAAHRLTLGFYAGRQYEQTRYSLLNSVRLIDVPGEYSVEPTADPKTWRVYLLPEKLVDGLPAGIGASRRPYGFSLQGASHVTVQGFAIRRQGNASQVSGLSAAGPAQSVTFRDCEVSLVRGGAAISASRVEDVLVERCHVHHNPGHTKGIVLHTCTRAVTRDCTLVKNTSTGLDYYTCAGGLVAGNTVTDHRGMHANGLTFYLGCKDIVVERNRVSHGHAALTFQEGENLTIRNNVFDGNGRGTVVGIWPGQPLKNVRILHNCILRSNHAVEWQTGLFTNSKRIEGLVVRNNIIDGLCGEGTFQAGTFSHNLYTRLGPDRQEGKLAVGEVYEPDLKKIFMDPDRDDFRLRSGSPALGAGTGAGVAEDIEGNRRAPGGAPDVGATGRGK